MGGAALGFLGPILLPIFTLDVGGLAEFTRIGKLVKPVPDRRLRDS
jgi:hypothetical protein